MIRRPNKRQNLDEYGYVVSVCVVTSVSACFAHQTCQHVLVFGKPHLYIREGCQGNPQQYTIAGSHGCPEHRYITVGSESP